MSTALTLAPNPRLSAPILGLLALGLSRNETIELGHLFDQNAVVWSGVDGVPELILLR